MVSSDALNQWQALTVYLEDGELEIDNGATERANCDRDWPGQLDLVR